VGRFLRRALAALLGLGVLAASILGALFLGYKLSDDSGMVNRYLRAVDTRIESLMRNVRGPEAMESRSYPTHLLTLRSEVARVDFVRDSAAPAMSQNGGGLTSFGRDVLLLPFDGFVYAASSAADIRRTRIQAPDNGREALRQLRDDPAFADYDISPGYLRYNGIIFIEDARTLAVNYTEYHPDRVCYTNTLAAIDIAPGVSSIDEVEAGQDDWRILHRTTPCLPLKRKYLAIEGHMAGGAMAFLPPSTLYWTSGDFHLDGMRSDPPAIAQNPEAQYGKVLAYDLATSEVRIASTGHRNPQGIAVTAGGQVYEVEHGPRGGDELNLIVEGNNYGWPLESLGTTYAQTSIPNSLSFARHESFTPPAMSWTPSVATSGIAYVNGFHPDWDGDLLLGSLIGESLIRVRLAQGRPVYSEAIRLGTRIRAVHQHTDGRLVLWTDSQNLIFLTGESPTDLEQLLGRFARSKGLSDADRAQVSASVLACAECHSFQGGDHERAPSLAQVFGSEIAATSYANYSDALRQKQGVWDRETLTTFLASPQDFAPGTSMAAANVDDAESLSLLVDFLEFYAQQF
jgi:cytochrome c2